MSLFTQPSTHSHTLLHCGFTHLRSTTRLLGMLLGPLAVSSVVVAARLPALPSLCPCSRRLPNPSPSTGELHHQTSSTTHKGDVTQVAQDQTKHSAAPCKQRRLVPPSRATAPAPLCLPSAVTARAFRSRMRQRCAFRHASCAPKARARHARPLLRTHPRGDPGREDLP